MTRTVRASSGRARASRSARTPRAICFVHGWAFDSGIWEGIRGQLGAHESVCVDLGFFSTPATSGELPDDMIWVGHSLGLLWILRHWPQRCAGLVSIAGFDCFHRHHRPANMRAMRRGLEVDAVAQIGAFWAASGFDTRYDRDDHDVKRLTEGLDWLMTWDEQARLRDLRCPVLVLAASDDAIVPPGMTRAIWGSDAPVWSGQGGHALPLTRADWCAAAIARFVSRIDARAHA